MRELLQEFVLPLNKEQNGHMDYITNFTPGAQNQVAVVCNINWDVVLENQGIHNIKRGNDTRLIMLGGSRNKHKKMGNKGKSMQKRIEYMEAFLGNQNLWKLEIGAINHMKHSADIEVGALNSILFNTKVPNFTNHSLTRREAHTSAQHSNTQHYRSTDSKHHTTQLAIMETYQWIGAAMKKNVLL
ncbi:hypothetical protein ACJX0J_040079 [Zea mays]